MQTLAKWQQKHHWRNKLWRIDDEILIKRILKQFHCVYVCTRHVFSRSVFCAAVTPHSAALLPTSKHCAGVSVKYLPRLLEIDSTGKELEDEAVFGILSKLHRSPSL